MGLIGRIILLRLAQVDKTALLLSHRLRSDLYLHIGRRLGLLVFLSAETYAVRLISLVLRLFSAAILNKKPLRSSFILYAP